MTSLDLAILGLLHDQELHGYEIRRRLRDELGGFATVSFGSLYPALSKLQSEGAVESAGFSWGARPPIAQTGSLSGERAMMRSRRSEAAPAVGSRRSRKVYRITDLGRARFAELVRSEMAGAGDEDRTFRVCLSFARHLPPDARNGLLELRRSQLTARLGQGPERRGAGPDRYESALAELAQEQTRREIAWVERLLEAERDAGADAPPDHAALAAARPTSPTSSAGPAAEPRVGSGG